ncbi:MAG: hypothetical protein RRZ24_05230 [Clostridia bacterium]
MKKVTITLIMLLLCIALFSACTPGSLLDLLAGVGGSRVSSGNAYYSTSGNAISIVTSGNG